MTVPVGIHLGFARRIPIPDRLRMIRDAGYDCTALWWPDVDGELRRLRDGVPDLTRRLGLEIDHVHVPYRGCDALWSRNASERRACVDRHIARVAECARHGLPRMVMHVTLKTRIDLDLECGITSMQALVEAAEESGVTLAIENMRRPEYVATLLDAIPSRRLALCYDNAHDELFSAEPGKLLAEYRNRLAVTHLSDTDGRRDCHWLPGDGVLDFREMADRVVHVNPRVACVIEAVTRESGEAAVRFLNRGRARLDALISEAHARAVHRKPRSA